MALPWKGWRGDQSSTQCTHRSMGSISGQKKSLFETWAKFMQIGQCRVLIPVYFGPCVIGQAVCNYQLVFTPRNTQLHGTCTMYLWKFGSITWFTLVFNAPPATDGRFPHLARTRALNSIKAESMWEGGCVFHLVQCNTFHLFLSAALFQGCTCPIWRI